jgi:TadE-like protein
MFRNLLRCTRATAAVEAAIFAPVFLLFTLGIGDLGMSLFARMQTNAAAQAGAIYGVINAGTGSVCETMTSTCLSGIKAVMNDASGDASFCTNFTCTASFAACDDGPKCITVTASYPYSPLLPDAVYSWTQSTTVASTAKIRIS